MGCDIHSFAEIRNADGTWAFVGNIFQVGRVDHEPGEEEVYTQHPFDWRSYGMYGFLAGVRNYSHSPVVAPPRHAIPDDVSPEVRAEYEKWEGDAHTTTWLSLRQLLDVDYDQVFWDRRVTREVSPGHFDGAALAEEGEGEMVSLREFLGTAFFRDLGALKGLGKPDDVRVVFWFDN